MLFVSISLIFGQYNYEMRHNAFKEGYLNQNDFGEERFLQDIEILNLNYQSFSDLF